MELIQIIYSILLIGGILLLVVVIISFYFSKTRAYYAPAIPIPESIINQNNNNFEQQLIRNSETAFYPQIFQIGQQKSREIKIIRKPTVSKREIQEQIRMEENHLNTDGNVKRYTIVNEEMRNKKLRFRAANFYL